MVLINKVGKVVQAYKERKTYLVVGATSANRHGRVITVLRTSTMLPSSVMQLVVLLCSAVLPLVVAQTLTVADPDV